MKKVVKILIVILVGLLTCFCLGIGGFYNTAVKTKLVYSEATIEDSEAAEDAEVTIEASENLPDDTGEAEEVEVIVLTLGEVVTDSIGLGALRNYLGVELFRSILICISVCGAFIEGILVSVLFKKKANTSATQIIELHTENQALEGYRIPKSGNGLKF